jgi:prephenate dehydrogenase
MISKLVVIGVGLIGGSFALALRQAGLVQHIVGVGRSPENMQRALKLGAIDELAVDFQSALKDAEIVFLSVPVGQTGEIMRKLDPHLKSGTIVTDAGSTKQDVVVAAKTHLAGHLATFVPGHPIAGAEQTGAGAARAGLFRGKNVILTPLDETDPSATGRVTELWQACGALVSLMNVRRHDKILAAVSHLPHVLAFALMHEFCGATVDPENGSNFDDALGPGDVLRFAGSGFRDFTRIAESSPEIWRDICLANRHALSDEIDAYQRQLAEIREMLQRGDGDSLTQVFSDARKARRNWLEKYRETVR